MDPGFRPTGYPVQNSIRNPLPALDAEYKNRHHCEEEAAERARVRKEIIESGALIGWEV
jgi:hypothetical protein